MIQPSLFLAIFLLASPLLAADAVPRFEDYPVASQSACRTITVDLKSHPRAREYRSQLRWAAEERCPEFAGHYIVADWGCGSPCQEWALIDVRTGRVTFLPIPTRTGAYYRVDSRLFEVNPDPGTLFVRSWWLWTGKTFKLLLEEPYP